MSSWGAAKAKRVLAALLRLGWQLKRESGSQWSRAALQPLRIRLRAVHSLGIGEGWGKPINKLDLTPHPCELYRSCIYILCGHQHIRSLGPMHGL